MDWLAASRTYIQQHVRIYIQLHVQHEPYMDWLAASRSYYMRAHAAHAAHAATCICCIWTGSPPAAYIAAWARIYSSMRTHL